MTEPRRIRCETCGEERALAPDAPEGLVMEHRADGRHNFVAETTYGTAHQIPMPKPSGKGKPRPQRRRKA